MKTNIFLSAILAATTLVSAAQQTLITGATLHLGNGETIESGYLGIGKNGTIDFVGPSAPLETYPEKINAQGSHVYPGFILPNTTLGIVEVSAVRASRDQAEVGSFNPNVRSLIAFNCESDIIPTAMDNGVLIGQITPRSGWISGTSSIVNLNCWNWEDAALKEDDGIHLNWPRPVIRKGWWAEPGGVERNKKYDEQLKEISDFLQDAKAYNAASNAKNDLRYTACKGLFTGIQTLFVHTNSAAAMLDALQLKDMMGIDKVVFVGAYEAHMITQELKDAETPILLRRLHDLPMHPDDPVHLPYTLANILTEAGLLVGLDMSGDMEQIQSRNLPFLAGTAAAYGMDTEEALKLITANTAKILGVDEWVGTLQKGKQATLFISSGNALEPKTNKVLRAFSAGQEIDLDRNKQKALYKRYQEKYK